MSFMDDPLEVTNPNRHYIYTSFINRMLRVTLTLNISIIYLGDPVFYVWYGHKHHMPCAQFSPSVKQFYIAAGVIC